MRYKVVVTNDKKETQNTIYFNNKDEAMNYAEYLANNIFKRFNEKGIKYFYSVDSNNVHIYNKSIHAYSNNDSEIDTYVDEEED